MLPALLHRHRRMGPSEGLVFVGSVLVSMMMTRKYDHGAVNKRRLKGTLRVILLRGFETAQNALIPFAAGGI